MPEYRFDIEDKAAAANTTPPPHNEGAMPCTSQGMPWRSTSSRPTRGVPMPNTQADMELMPKPFCLQQNLTENQAKLTLKALIQKQKMVTTLKRWGIVQQYKRRLCYKRTVIAAGRSGERTTPLSECNGRTLCLVSPPPPKQK